jgi:hypothetical protein
MKKQAYMIMAITMLIGIMSVSARAQNNKPYLIANIPFEFTVGNQTMPAGEYTVSVANPSSDLKVLRLRATSGHDSVMLQTRGVSRNASGDAKLVFNRYGNQYFFAQAWFQADSTGMQASKSRSEKQIVRELAANKLSREVVAIKARR